MKCTEEAKAKDDKEVAISVSPYLQGDSYSLFRDQNAGVKKHLLIS